MALRWDFKTDFIGTATDGRDYTFNLYDGNALVIMVYETEKQYNLMWFAADEEHLKNMLADEDCRDDIAKLSLTIKAEALKRSKVKTLVKLLMGHARITIAGPNEVIEAKIYPSAGTKE